MARCTALACPRLKNFDPTNRAMSITVASSQVTRDKAGHTWCNFCQKQRELMNYGHEHKWPAVQIYDARLKQNVYMLLHDAHDWFATIACSNQETIDNLYTELIVENKASA